MALPQDFKQEGGNGRYTMGHLKTTPKVKFRVLSDFISGKCVWGEPEGKRLCTRKRPGEAIPVGAIGTNPISGQPERVKQFIAAVVYNYSTEQVEILETDKATIIGQLVEIEANEDWGDCKQYDLTISKAGEGMDTKYSVLPSPGKFTKSVEWKNIDLNDLYEGEDPFRNAESTKESFDAEDVADDIPF